MGTAVFWENITAGQIWTTARSLLISDLKYSLSYQNFFSCPILPIPGQAILLEFNPLHSMLPISPALSHNTLMYIISILKRLEYYFFRFSHFLILLIQFPYLLKLHVSFNAILKFCVLKAFWNKTLIPKDTWITVFIAALFTTAKIWKQPKCS